MKFIRILLILFVISILFIGCGPSRKEIAQREAIRIENQARLEARKAKLAEQVEKRIAAGESRPTRYNEPQFNLPIAICEPKPPGDKFSSFSGIGGEYAICANTNIGREILEWRKWYCKGEEISCVLSRWKDGHPTFGWYRTGTSTVNFGGGNILMFIPVRFEWPSK